MTDLIERTLHALGMQLPGSVPRPGSDGYAAATAIWAKPTGRMPRAVVHCRRASRYGQPLVPRAIAIFHCRCAAEDDDWAGRALCDGIVIDPSRMRGVLVDGEDLSAYVAGGARASDIVRMTDQWDSPS